jgi:uncharacterized protein YodC (DUF2158 family)
MLMTTVTERSIYDCEVGDTVRRKRGGARMTIERLERLDYDCRVEDTVRHKRGGPRVTIERIDSGMDGGPYRHLAIESCDLAIESCDLAIESCDLGVHCVWHDDGGWDVGRQKNLSKLKRDVFSADALRVIPPSYTCHVAPPIGPGDPVQFRHGGPKMQIEEIDSLGVHCSWPGGRDVFPAAVLRYVGE